MDLPWFNNQQFPLYLAPMAGVTDIIFRHLCKDLGADVMVTEFVSAEGILQANYRTRHYTQFDEDERPLGVQLFGSNPDKLGEAAQVIVERDHPDFIDLNFGCPVNKVVSKNGGSSLLKDLPLLEAVAQGVVKAVGDSVPVTAKIRLGWDSHHIVALDVCKILEQAGISCVTIHGRTKVQNYGGEADWDMIHTCAKSVSIPVIGNGDIRTVQDAIKRKNETAVSGLMIGRGAMEYPWIFEDIKFYLKNKKLPPERSMQDRWALALKHVNLALELGRYGREETTMKHMRARLIAYTKGFPKAKELRLQLTKVVSLQELKRIAQDFS